MNRKLIYFLVATFIIGNILLVLYNKGIFGLKESSASGRLANILDRGELVVGIDATYAPLEFIDENGEFAGMDVDFMKEIAKDLGVKVVFKNIIWNDLFDSIQRGDVDLSASSITITAERAKFLGFSDPYFNAGQVIVSTKSAAGFIHGPNDLKGLRIGAQVNTTSDIEAKKYATSQDMIYNFEEYAYAKDELLAGKIDAIIIDYPAGASMVAGDSRLATMGEIFTQEFYGIATQKGEDALISKLNKIIRRLKQDGVLKNLEEKWITSK